MQFSRYNRLTFVSQQSPEPELRTLFINKCYYLLKSGSLLLSHTVASIVSSAVWVLTIVFGMGTGVTPRRIITGSGIKWTRTTDLTLIRRAL